MKVIEIYFKKLYNFNYLYVFPQGKNAGNGNPWLSLLSWELMEGRGFEQQRSHPYWHFGLAL
jgi:hypothetical protein